MELAKISGLMNQITQSILLSAKVKSRGYSLFSRDRLGFEIKMFNLFFQDGNSFLQGGNTRINLAYSLEGTGFVIF